jgi:CDP-4-dehydro-6-deoxyglucose reductase, E3
MHKISTTRGKSFTASQDESLLDAALRAGVVIAYSCHTGRCSTCKAQIRRGITVPLHEELGLSRQEQDEGWILTCVRAAESSVELDVEDLGDVELFPARVLPTRIQSLDRVSVDVLRAVLRLPPAAEFKYHAGQYLDVLGPGGLRRSYSIANAPGRDRLIELHIRRVSGGAMSQYWFDQAKVNDLLRINGPLGTFFLRGIENQDLVFLATGTGIAPIKAMLEDLARIADTPRVGSISVFWGGRTTSDLYWTPDVDLDLRFIPVLSRPLGDWAGACGYVQHAFLEQQADLDRIAVYACGSEAMIESARKVLAAAGLPEWRFHSDAFVCSSAVA